MLLSEFPFGPYGPNITPPLHEAQIDLNRYSQSDSLYKKAIHDKKKHRSH
jgi:hypothetical protein